MATILLGVLAWFFLPYRNRLETRRTVLTNDHGVALLTYSTPDEMGGLRVEDMLDVEPAWLVDHDFYFAGGVPGPGPTDENEWADWARGHGGVGVGWRHILVRIQATQDRTVLVLPPS